MTRQRWLSPAALGMIFTMLCIFVAFGDAAAQTVTGTIRGRVVNESGAAVTSATVTARNPETGATRVALSNADGTYVLAGLQPGTYEIGVSMIGYSAPPRSVRVLIGQSLSMDLALQPQAIEVAGINVIGTRAIETKTSEIATNVTEEQIEGLPQGERNFLNFAALAPGITVSRDELNKNISAGGLSASKINVFIDGASFKNDVLEGGVHGQDASRGNPFPQIALQEFRVLTQNFKAEYQRAASAVILPSCPPPSIPIVAGGRITSRRRGCSSLHSCGPRATGGDAPGVRGGCWTRWTPPAARRSRRPARRWRVCRPEFPWASARSREGHRRPPTPLPGSARRGPEVPFWRRPCRGDARILQPRR